MHFFFVCVCFLKGFKASWAVYIVAQEFRLSVVKVQD